MNYKSNEAFTEEENAIIQSQLSGSNDNAFKRLYGGDYRNYPSWDDAEQALCEQLAVLCHGNPELIDSLFRKSNMARPDWDESWNGTTCGQYMIEKAIQKMKTNTCSVAKDWKELHNSVG